MMRGAPSLRFRFTRASAALQACHLAPITRRKPREPAARLMYIPLIGRQLHYLMPGERHFKITIRLMQE